MTDPIMDAGAWRREALGLRERVRELEAALLEERYACAAALDAANDLRAEREALVMEVSRVATESMRRALDLARIEREVLDLRAERDRMRAVVEAAREVVGNAEPWDTSDEAVRSMAWLAEVLGALPCVCGHNNGNARHLAGCPKGGDDG